MRNASGISILSGFLAAGLCACGSVAHAQQDADELAKQLANPVASLISVPLQNNVDFKGGPNRDGVAYTLNIQPVIPIPLNPEWMMISRTILPVTSLHGIFSNAVTGNGDITQSLFFSPTHPTASGLIWGVGPALLFPTATDPRLGTGKWAAGPTLVALTQQGPWTIGFLGNHLWSYAGRSDRSAVNQTFMQPFLSYSFGGGTSVGLNLESSYNWTSRQWSVPVNLSVSQVLKFNGQPISISVGGKYYLATVSQGPRWGARAVLTFLFPTK